MARAICTQCGEEFYWYGGRGRKLADIVSPCCKAPAKGKTGARKARPVHPSIKCKARTDAYIQPGHWMERDTTITLLPDGHIYTTWTFLFHHQLSATDEIKDGWRLFVDDRANQVNYRCKLREEDWQRLLKKVCVQS